MRFIILSAFALGMVACDGPDPIAPSDAAAPAQDAAAPAQDAAAPAQDAAAPAQDAAAPAQDAAAPAQDAAAPVLDAAAPVQDAGAPAADAGPMPGVCGTRGINIVTCPAGQFCNFPIGNFCGRTDMGGACMFIPEACAEIYDPVCGCDGNTYGNACEAAEQSVSVETNGACDSRPPQQGDGACGRPNAPMMCANSHFCDRPAGSCPVGNESTGGTCQPRPNGCDRRADPVCGCDNQEYNNPCRANVAGTSVRNQGPCR